MRIIATLVLLALAPPLYAQPQSLSTGDPLLDRFITVSGMEQCISLGAGQLDALIEQERGKMEEEAFELFSEAMRHAFAPDAMRDDGIAKLRIAMDADTAQAVIAWLEAPLGKRLVAMETAAAQVSDDAIQAYAKDLNGEEAAVQVRVALVQRLHESLNSTERSVDMITAMMEAMLTAMNGIVPAEQRMSQEQSAQIVEGMRAQLLESMPSYLLIHSLHTYREASSEDLNSYVEFLSSPIGQWYSRVTVEASSASMSNVGKRLGETMASQHAAR